jgi:hypothetical protein
MLSGFSRDSNALPIDKKLLEHGLSIPEAVLHIKGILSQHIVLRQEVMTEVMTEAVRGVSARVSSILVREFRLSVIR